MRITMFNLMNTEKQLRFVRKAEGTISYRQQSSVANNIRLKIGLNQR